MLTVHHLNMSRSTRVLWLLEEIGTPYRLVRHEREPGFRAPESLRAVHPLGKAPMIEDDGHLILESAVILAYLADRYAPGRFAPDPGGNERLRHDAWLHFVEGTGMLPVMMLFLGQLTGGLPDPLAGFARREIDTVLGRIDETVATGPFLLGDRFSIADIQLAYLIEGAAALGSLAAFPGLEDYRARLHARGGYQRAIEIGGPMLPGS